MKEKKGANQTFASTFYFIIFGKTREVEIFLMALGINFSVDLMKLSVSRISEQYYYQLGIKQTGVPTLIIPQEVLVGHTDHPFLSETSLLYDYFYHFHNIGKMRSKAQGSKLPAYFPPYGKSIIVLFFRSPLFVKSSREKTLGFVRALLE